MNAQTLSATEIDALTQFSKHYLPLAFRFLEGRSISSGVMENVAADQKATFCISLLAMTEIPEDVRKTCAGSTIRSGMQALSFDQQVRRTHPVRACAHYDFLVHERAERLSEAGNSSDAHPVSPAQGPTPAD